MVLGNYYLTIEKLDELGQGSIFKDVNEAIKAYDTKQVSLHAIIGIRVASLGASKFAATDQNKFLITTIGKIIFNQMFSERMPFINRPNIINLTETHNEDLVTTNVDFREFIKKELLLNHLRKNL